LLTQHFVTVACKSPACTYRHEYFRDRGLGLRRLAFSNSVEDAEEKQFDSESK